MTLVVLIVLVALVSLIMFIYKLKTRSTLSKNLGRAVQDHELTSLTSWMDAVPDKKETRKYVPAKSDAPEAGSPEFEDR